MKASSFSVFVSMCLILLGASIFTAAQGEECDGQYFAPKDTDKEFALKRPHSEFAKEIRLAGQGIAVNQRNLAACRT